MPEHRVNLFLLPYAGGAGTAFGRLIDGLPNWVRPIPVTLPGRGARFRDSIVTHWPRLVDQLAKELIADAREPYALFGHSLGALVALELAHRFRLSGCDEPVWLAASGCVAPTVREPGEDWLGCDEAVFIERLRRLGGTPAELLENRDLLDLYLPALRADFHLASSYSVSPRDPLRSAMLILGGRNDTDVVWPPERLAAWSAETSGISRIHLLPGGHFFINEQGAETARLISGHLAEALEFQETIYG